MSDQLSKIEDNITMLSLNQREVMTLITSLKDNNTKLTVAFETLSSFRTETATHRQHDQEFKADIKKSLETLINNQQRDTKEVFRSIRHETAARNKLQKDHSILNNQVEGLTTTLSDIEEKRDKRGDKWRNSFITIFVSSVASITTYFTTK